MKDKHYELKSNGDIKEISERQYQKNEKKIKLLYNADENCWVILDESKGFDKEGAPKKMSFYSIMKRTRIK